MGRERWQGEGKGRVKQGEERVKSYLYWSMVYRQCLKDLRQYFTSEPTFVVNKKNHICGIFVTFCWCDFLLVFWKSWFFKNLEFFFKFWFYLIYHYFFNFEIFKFYFDLGIFFIVNLTYLQIFMTVCQEYRLFRLFKCSVFFIFVSSSLSQTCY